MNNFNIHDLDVIKNNDISRTTMKRQFNKMLESSMKCYAIVESMNIDTGEYRIVVQGTLDNRDTW